MNCGIQDAHNLAWKIAAAHHGSPDGDKLLESYEKERRPIACEYAALSVRNYERTLDLARCIGLDAVYVVSEATSAIVNASLLVCRSAFSYRSKS